MTILKLGIEVEWSCLPKPGHLYEPEWEAKYDGSIRGRYESIEYIIKRSHLINIDTRNPNPGIEKACQHFKKLVDAMNKIDVNESQGLHFHVSGFKKKYVLYSKEFYDTLISEYKEKAKTELEKSRIDTYYARFKYDANGNLDRRLAINYRYAYRKHGTYEFRLFPSTKKVSEFRKYLKMLIKHIRRAENYKVKLDRISGEDDETNYQREVVMEEVLL